MSAKFFEFIIYLLHWICCVFLFGKTKIVKILEAMNRTLRLALKVFIWSYRLRLECWTMLSFRWRFQALKQFGLVLTLEWNRNAQNTRCVYMRMNWIFLVFCLNHHKTMLLALFDDQFTNLPIDIEHYLFYATNTLINDDS